MNPPDWAESRTETEDQAAPELPEGAELPVSVERRWELFLESRERFALPPLLPPRDNHDSPDPRLAFCLLGNIEDAEDLVQDTGLRVLRHPTGPRNEACFLAWCKGLVRNA